MNYNFVHSGVYKKWTLFTKSQMVVVVENFLSFVY